MLWNKAAVIARLDPCCQQGKIARHLSFTYLEWQQNPKKLLETINTHFTHAIIVRSSCDGEDGPNNSHAGEYISLANIDHQDCPAIEAAINQVFQSYPNLHDQQNILIQAMVSNVALAGVITTRTSPAAAPYYTINYQFTDQSSAITQGQCDSETVVLHRDHHTQLSDLEPAFKNLMPAIIEVEYCLKSDALDIEFVIDEAKTVWILQARPITSIDEDKRNDDEDIKKGIEQMQAFFDNSQPSHQQLCGSSTFYGNMPDINPAELIGAKPKPLSFSLYREIVTDQVATIARATFGYREMTQHPLMLPFSGQPYVDIRTSFNTYLPKALSDELCTKLTDYYLKCLHDNPQLHDKVEFDILITTIGFDFDQQQQQLIQAGFSHDEVKQLTVALTDITNNTFKQCDKSLALLKQLEPDYQRIMNDNQPPLLRAIALMESNKQYGTLAFVEVARCAFAAVSIIQSMIRDNIISKTQVDAFMNTLHTVASDIQHDGAAVDQGTLAWETFIERYGHLRPGTYEISYPCYREDPELYLRPMIKPLADHLPKEQLFEDPEVRKYLSNQLNQWQLDISIDEFSRFLKESIEAREYAKFLFTRNLSASLEAIVEFGQSHGFTREDMAYIDYPNLAALNSVDTTTDTTQYLSEHIHAGKQSMRRMNAIELPQLIRRREDITAFRLGKSAANYVTQQTVSAEVIHLNHQIRDRAQLKGKIVLVQQADPGFDWIFSCGIAGLITQYGGVNSHIAIRCAELDIPAAIGTGRKHYSQLLPFKMLCLDTQGKRIKPIH